MCSQPDPDRLPVLKPCAAPIEAERLVDYFHGMLSDSEARTIEEHLADCDRCVELARLVRATSGTVMAWTARAHGEADRRAQLAQAVERAADRVADPEWCERLRRWKEQCAGQAAAAVRLVRGVGEQASRFITEGMETLQRPGGLGPFTELAFSLPAGAVPTKGAVQTKGAVRTRGGVRVSGGVKVKTRGSVTAVETRGTVGARARVEVRGDVLDVRVSEWPPQQTPPLVILIPVGQPGEPQVAVLARTSRTSISHLERRLRIGYSRSARLMDTMKAEQPPSVPLAGEPTELQASFEGIAPGDYIVAIEPME